MILQALIIYNELLYVLTWQHQFSTTMATDHLQIISNGLPGQAGCQVCVYLWLGPNCCCCCCWWWWWWWLVVGCLVAWLVRSFLGSFVCLFVCLFVLLLLSLSLSSSSLLLLFLLLFSHENKLMDFIFFLNPLPVRLNVLRYQKSLAKRTIR